jgi:hypothetical protein
VVGDEDGLALDVDSSVDAGVGGGDRVVMKEPEFMTNSKHKMGQRMGLPVCCCICESFLITFSGPQR